ncbi:MAG: glycosyltransferase family 4 protein [Alteromonadaceae bacterium]|nr:glycosyltransferase family 4 protein [Alteromonadaceae bacterium]
MAPIRVAFLNLQSGSHGEYGALLAAAVGAQEGVEVLVIAPEKLLKASDRARTSLETVQCRTVPMDGSVVTTAKSLRRVWKMLKAFKPDIIHEPVGSGVSAILPLRPFLPRLAPLVVTEHNPEPHPGVKGRHHGIARSITRKTAALIHVHGPQAHADMVRLGVPADRLALIRHGAFDEYGAEARTYDRTGSRQILIFGTQRPNKGFDMLPEIFDKVRAAHPDATMVITGKRSRKMDGEMAAEMIRALDRLAETPGCNVMDARVEEEEVPRLFGECGVCLLPYRSATQSGVAMIAMATGAPLVATSVGDIPDIVDDGRTGLLAPPDPDALAARVIEVFNDPAKTRARADAALAFTREECAWPVIGAKMAAAYRNLIGAG